MPVSGAVPQIFRAAHFHDAVRFQQLNKSVDLRGLAANFDDQCLRRIVCDFGAENVNHRHDILPLFRNIAHLNEEQFPDNGLIPFHDFNGFHIVHFFQLLDNLVADCAVAVGGNGNAGKFGRFRFTNGQGINIKSSS